MAAEQAPPNSPPATEANPSEQSQSAGPSGKGDAVAVQPLPPVTIPQSAPQAATADPSAGDPNYYTREDLEAQRGMARSTDQLVGVAWWQFGLSVLGLFLLVATVHYAKRAAEETKRTADITRDIGDAELRPYVDVSEANFYWDHVGARVVVSCQNSGQTPATFFEVKFHTQAIPIGDPRGFVLPPEDAKSLVWSTIGGNRTVTAGLHNPQVQTDAETTRMGGGFTNFYIFGVVRYGDISGAEYETEFAYYSPRARPTPDNDKPVTLIRPDGKLRAFVMVNEPNKKAEQQAKGRAHLGALRTWLAKRLGVFPT